MSYQRGPPADDIALSLSPDREQYPSSAREHDHPPASSPTPNAICTPSNGPRPATTASQPTADRRKADKYAPDETVVDLHVPVQEKKNTVHAVNVPSEPRMTGAKEMGAPIAEAVMTRGAEIKLSQKRKWFLLLVFSVAQVSDGASRVYYFAEYHASTSTLLAPRVSSSSRKQFLLISIFYTSHHLGSL